MAQGVFVQVGFGLEGHVTLATLVGQTALVSQHMDPLVLLTGEFLVTNRTDERLLSRVEPVVGGESLLLLERHRTDVTLEGVILQMSVDVIFEFNLISKRLSAVLTWERSLCLVNGSDMFLQ